jgi:hypothetical protein
MGGYFEHGRVQGFDEDVSFNKDFQISCIGKNLA